MPDDVQVTEISAAWALVCILQILATDSPQAFDDKLGSEIVMPPPGLDLPGGSVGNAKKQPIKGTKMQVSLLWLSMLSSRETTHGSSVQATHKLVMSAFPVAGECN